jgi:hypothetical protein
MTSPLKTDVSANETPLTVPTRPLARSRSASGTSSVTQVDRTMPRSCPATEPSSVEKTSSQNHGPRSCSRSFGSTARKTAVAIPKQVAETTVVSISASCLRCRSTKVPNHGPRPAATRL